MFQSVTFFMCVHIAKNSLVSLAGYQTNGYDNGGHCSSYIRSELNSVDTKISNTMNELNKIDTAQRNMQDELESKMINMEVKMDAHLWKVQTELENQPCQKTISQENYESRLQELKSKMEQQLQRQTHNQMDLSKQLLQVETKLKNQKTTIENFVDKITRQQAFEKCPQKTMTKDDLEKILQAFQIEIKKKISTLGNSLQSHPTKTLFQPATVRASTQTTTQTTTQATPLKTQSKPDFKVPSKFKQIGERYFYIESYIKKTWTEAEASCRDMGWYLASIKDESELQTLAKQLEKYCIYWLGINDREKKGEYRSVASGMRAMYLRRDSTRNIRYASNSHCVRLMNGYMEDRSCYEQHYYICQNSNEI